jgi:PAS domain S-box-containing protein
MDNNSNTAGQKKQMVALRRKAREVLQDRRNGRGAPSVRDPERLLHELDVHRVELEMQNEQLRSQQSELEKSQARYADLYDLAPVSYLTLDAHGRILEVNRTGARLLGVAQGRLIRRSFRGFVDSPSQAAFLAHLAKVFKKRAGQSSHLRLLRADGTALHARLVSLRTDHDPEYGRCCRSAIIDTTEKKKVEDALNAAHAELEQRVQQRTRELSKTNRALESQARHRQLAEQALKQAHDELERRVQQRTAELLQTNQALAAEIAQRLEAEQARHRVLRRLIEIQEAERGRIARGLHDQFGQDLAALSLALKRLSTQLPARSELRPQVGQAMVTLGNLMREAHSLVWDLRPPALDDLGLSAVLQRCASKWAQLHNVPVDFHSRGLDRQRLPPTIEITLYRIAQEALTNIFKHAQAKRVSLLLDRQPDHVALIIEDRGRGFQAEATLQKNGASINGHLGLLGMRERAILAGGTLEIESTPGAGTTIYTRIPLPAPAGPNQGTVHETHPRPARRRPHRHT